MGMKKSIARIGDFAIIAPTAPSSTETYGPVNWFESKKSGGREYKAEPKGEVAEVYADGKAVLSVDDNSGYDITLTLLTLVDDVQENWLGRKPDRAGGIPEYANAAERPRRGLAIAESTTDGTGIITFYYNCQVSKRPSKAGKTSEGKLEGQFQEIAIAARPRAEDTLVCYETKGNELVKVVPLPDLSTQPAPPEDEG